MTVGQVLNALVWGTSLRALARKGPMGLNVSPARGGMLWLEVGQQEVCRNLGIGLAARLFGRCWLTVGSL